jgi:pimeloyl-ACP methyl ester carboxylesterase
MYYEIHGAGDPLVMIHGGGSTLTTSFGKIIPLLAKNHLVIAVELQAHGHTSDRETPESFEQDAADVAGLLQFLEIAQADFFGFSNGGQTALQLGISYPEKVRKLVIASAFYKREGAIPGFFNGMDGATIGNMPAYLKEAFLALGNDQSSLQNMFEKDKARMITFRGWRDEEIEGINAPSLIIAGNQDVLTPEHAVEMSKRIKGAELMILPGNHGSYMGEGLSANENSRLPELVVSAVSEFLKMG